MAEAGVAVALATDVNPGTCPIPSLPLITGLGCAPVSWVVQRGKLVVERGRLVDGAGG